MKTKIIKKCAGLTVLVLAAVLLAAVLPFTASAATSGICGDDAYWSLYNGTLTISGRGRMYDRRR